MASRVSSPVVDRTRLAYSRRRLLALRHAAGTKLCTGVCELSAAGLLRYRGRRAGVRSFIRSELQVKVVDFPSYKSFELLPLFVRIGAMSFVFVLVYRPNPASTVTDSFFVEWADVLERTSSFAGCVIVGDVNLHVSDVTNISSMRFLTLLDNFNLSDRVKQPTRAENQLDIFVSRLDQPAPVIRVDPPMLSDHSLIVASLEVIDRRALDKPTVRRRPWRTFDYDAFSVDLEESVLILDPPTDVNELFACYDATLIRLLDKHAPLRNLKSRHALLLLGSTSNAVTPKPKPESSRKPTDIIRPQRTGRCGERISLSREFFISRSSQTTGPPPSVLVSVIQRFYGRSYDHCCSPNRVPPLS